MEGSSEVGAEPETAAAFEEFVRAAARGGAAPAGARYFFSPGRVNLMGAHLDYNGGPVMPTAIDRGTFLELVPRRDARIRVTSELDGAPFEAELGALPTQALGTWADYPLGVVLRMTALAREHGRDPRRGFELRLGGNLAVGAGLSSSASVCVGTALALDEHWELGCTTRERVEIALDAERGHVGVQCGIMDPYAVGFSRPGSLMWLDCRRRVVEHVPFDTARLAIAVADSGVRRELARGEFNLRVQQCAEAFRALREHVPDADCLAEVPLEELESRAADLDPVVARRARHVLEEVRRTHAARAALERGEPEGFGSRMTEAHASLRESFEVSCPELDLLVERATSVPGVLGSRLTGAGFGGCIVALCEAGALEALRAELADSFGSAFGRIPEVRTFRGDPGPRELTPS